MVQAKLPGIHGQMSNSKAGHQLSPAQLPLRKISQCLRNPNCSSTAQKGALSVVSPESVKSQGPTIIGSTHLPGHWVPNAFSLASPILVNFTVFWRTRAVMRV